MARVKDLWFAATADGAKVQTRRHPDRGGNKDAKRYLAIWTDPAGHERSKAFGRKKAAETYAGDQEADVRRGEYIGRDAGKALVGTLAGKWLRLREVGAGTQRRYDSVYRLHIEPVFGARPAGAVKPSEVAEWSRTLADRPPTRRLALIILSGIFDLAVADGARRDNPARSAVVSRPAQADTTSREAWGAERVLAVSAACGSLGDVPMAAAGLGLRPGEVFGLGLGDLDGSAGVAQVRRQVAWAAPAGLVFKLPKGGKERTVPLPHGVAALAAGREAVIVTLPWLAENGKLGAPVTVPLIFSRAGQVIGHRRWDRQVWKPALAAAGVIPPYTSADYPVAREHGMHALRHFYDTLLLDNGVSVAAVMQFMGHSVKGAPLAVGVYGHVTPAAFESARNAVDRTLFGLRSVRQGGTVTELRAAR